MEITGTVKRVLNTQIVGASGFKKRELHIETGEQYPQTLSIEFTQDKCELLDNLMDGESVTIMINLRGREWINPEGETVVFNSIQGWKIKSEEI